MQKNFAAIIAFTLKYEGGWSDNPTDPGGATMNGVTLDLYRVWKQNAALTATDLRGISPADVSAIYQQQFWARVRGDELPSGVDLMVADMAFNAGANASIVLLQQCLGVHIDGAFGATTLAAVLEDPPSALIRSLASHQTAYYQSLTNYKMFGQGWLIRVTARREAALALANAEPIPAAPPNLSITPPATPSPPSPSTPVALNPESLAPATLLPPNLATTVPPPSASATPGVVLSSLVPSGTQSKQAGFFQSVVQNIKSILG